MNPRRQQRSKCVRTYGQLLFFALIDCSRGEKGRGMEGRAERESKKRRVVNTRERSRLRVEGLTSIHPRKGMEVG